MAIQLEEVQAFKNEFEDEYRARHDAFRNLRRYWHGDYWRMADTESASRSIASVFRDITSRQSDVGPDIKLVHNVVQMVCVKYQTFLSPLPQIRVYPDPPESDTRRAQATRKERYLYGCWSMGSMDKRNSEVGWYLPLMGSCFHGIWPDFDTNVPCPVLRSPEYAFPIPGFDGKEEAYIFSWKVRESVVRRRFPGYVPDSQRRRILGMFSRRGQDTDPMVELTEWSDQNEFSRWVGAQRVNGVEHGFGFNLFEHMKFITVPDEVWGHGAVEQAINLNEMGNALYSLMFDAVIANVFPRLILEGPEGFPEQIDAGPGAVIPVQPGGKAYWLHPPVQALGMQENFKLVNDKSIMQASGMEGVNFGQSPASSIVTGKAVNELEGAATGSTIEMVQGIGIGNGMVAWNEKALAIGQRMFAEEKINLYGLQPNGSYDVHPRQFALTLKGKDLVGGTRNEVTFSPAISLHEKIVMNLQMAGGGLVSKEYQRNQAGIPDSEAMEEAIFNEHVDEIVLGFLLQTFQQAPEAGKVEGVEQEAAGLLAGSTQPHPLLAAANAPAVGPAQQAGLPAPAPGPPPGPPGGGALPAGPPPGGPGPAPGPASGPAPAAAAAAQPATLDKVVSAFQSVKGVTGRVFLVGEIVQRGQTDAEIEVAITERSDEQALSGLPFDLSFHVIAGEPSEPFVEVTPGRAPRPGGGAEQQAQAPGG